MRLNELTPAPGSRKHSKRVGRGNSSGHGTYSTRGCKGEKARSGFKIRPGFEGGQLPMIKRLPRKRGFTNMSRVEYSVVNTDELNVFQTGTEINPETLLVAGLVKSLSKPVKILGTGELESAFVVKAHKFSSTAKSKIESAGGSVEELVYAPEPV